MAMTTSHARTSRFTGTILAGLLALVMSILIAPTAPPARAAGSLHEVTSFGSNPGNLRMFEYIPDGLPENAPVVVALHGGTQSASQYATYAGWTEVADRWKFAVIFPEQKRENQSGLGFNWFMDSDNCRGCGEPASIVQMVNRTHSVHGTDSSRAFVTGLSAGGGMTTVMLATYPDVFAGGAVVAGVPYGCAHDFASGNTCTFAPPNWTPQMWGDKVRAAYPGTPPAWPAVTVWHGDQDYIANSKNKTELMEQWTNVHGIDQVADQTETINGHPHELYKNSAGQAKVDVYTLRGMGHGQPVDPGSTPDKCGRTDQHFLDVNMCVPYYQGRIWSLDQGATG